MTAIFFLAVVDAQGLRIQGEGRTLDVSKKLWVHGVVEKFNRGGYPFTSFVTFLLTSLWKFLLFYYIFLFFYNTMPPLCASTLAVRYEGIFFWKRLLLPFAVEVSWNQSLLTFLFAVKTANIWNQAENWWKKLWNPAENWRNFFKKSCWKKWYSFEMILINDVAFIKQC